MEPDLSFKPVKRCPFCGGDPKLDFDYMIGIYWVWCTKCFAETCGSKDRFVAVEYWDRRYLDD
mgnify:CR=1 FL=1